MERMKKLIITGDDFGFTVPVNEAIEEAHCRGVLTTASLMMGSTATGDAVERARRLPSLKIGLHLVLVDGRPVSPAQEVPNLVDSQGEFSSHLVCAGINFFFRPRVRRQLEEEIRAQFQAFQKTGFPLDHVNTHHHMHLHPTVLRLVLKVGREFGLRAIRLPYEPILPSWRASRKGFFQKAGTGLVLAPWIALLKGRLKRANICSNQFVFGMNDSGKLDLDLVLRLIKNLPPGISEIYFHPAICQCPEMDRTIEHRGHQLEFEALTSPVLQEALRASGVETITFSDL